MCIEGLTTEFQVLPCGMESSELFGDNNTRVRSTSVIIIKKLHEIPYHTVNTWNEVVSPFLPLEFVSLYKINVFSTGVLRTVSAHDKRELGTLNLWCNLPRVASRYVCAYNVHEIAVSRKVRGVYE